MPHLVFMLEEPSAKILLDNLLPKILPAEVTFQCLPHEGKSDLRKSIPIKLRNWNTPDTWFVILHDKDHADCHDLKRQLFNLCQDAGRPESLVRIVIHELESWFLGDLKAVETAFAQQGLARRQKQRKFRDPDDLANAPQELKNLIPGYQKMAGARLISPHLSLSENRSESFNQLCSGIIRFIAKIANKD